MIPGYFVTSSTSLQKLASKHLAYLQSLTCTTSQPEANPATHFRGRRARRGRPAPPGTCGSVMSARGETGGALTKRIRSTFPLPRARPRRPAHHQRRHVGRRRRQLQMEGGTSDGRGASQGARHAQCLSHIHTRPLHIHARNTGTSCTHNTRGGGAPVDKSLSTTGKGSQDD